MGHAAGLLLDAPLAERARWAHLDAAARVGSCCAGHASPGRAEERVLAVGVPFALMDRGAVHAAESRVFPRCVGDRAAANDLRRDDEERDGCCSDWDSPSVRMRTTMNDDRSMG